MANIAFRIGIDLGGTKIEGIVLDGQGRELHRLRVATPHSSYTKTLNQIVELIQTLEKDLPKSALVGIGTPGAVSSVTGRMKNCNSGCLNQQALQEDLQQLLQREIRLANDADCFALSEAVDGAGQGRDNVFGVILGTGVGGGVVIKQHLLRGPNAIAGEWGHNPLPADVAPTIDNTIVSQLCNRQVGLAENKPFQSEQRLCYCGRSNCIETYLSGAGLRRTYFELTALECSVEKLVERAENGDAAALLAKQIYQIQLACCLSQVINILDPDVVVLGGGLSNIPQLAENVLGQLSKYVFTDQVFTHVVSAQHGDSSGVRGAAWLWP